jgi:hypothetical protein
MAKMLSVVRASQQSIPDKTNLDQAINTRI